MDTRILLAALQEVEKRAERVSDDDVLATYVNIESLTNALAARDNGIVFGRRGTGKTHALKYVAKTERDKGNRVVYIDLEQDVGSTEGRYADPNLSISERATSSAIRARSGASPTTQCRAKLSMPLASTSPKSMLCSDDHT